LTMLRSKSPRAGIRDSESETDSDSTGLRFDRSRFEGSSDDAMKDGVVKKEGTKGKN
jgi:hypothetical protein